jgi:uncharacterized Fe-S cluster-containing radical SAM superfamily protein
MASTQPAQTALPPENETLDGKTIHPLASIFPPMNPEEFDAICEDVAQNGLVEPIVLLGGQILDGTHRLKACLAANIQPRYQEWDGEGGTPMQYVWSRNWTRRHLSAGQRAVISLAAEKELAREAKQRMSPKHRKEQGVEGIPQAAGSGKARDLAGRLAAVNARYVQDAKLIEKTSPDLLEQVRLGELTLPAAVRKAKKKDKGNAQPQSTSVANHSVRLAFGWTFFQSECMSEDKANELRDEYANRFSSEGDFSVQVLQKDGKPANAGSHMYADAQTWNPYKGCEFACSYCVPSFQQQAKRQQKNCKKCAQYKPHTHPDRLDAIPKSKIVFVCGNGDISFCEPAFVRRIIEAIKNHRGKQEQVFYLQSKEPACLKPYLDLLPENVYLVTTLETNRDEGYESISKAPPPSKRFKQFLALDYPKKVVTIEPALDFDVEVFASWIEQINPLYVWLGMNSRASAVQLPEPSPKKLQEFARLLVDKGIEVRGKHLRGIEMPKGVKRYQD